MDLLTELTCFSLHPLDLTFLHEGSKTLVDGLVNIEKLVSGTANPSPASGGWLASNPSPGTATSPKDSRLSPWCPACLTDSQLSPWWHCCGNPPTGGKAGRPLGGQLCLPLIWYPVTPTSLVLQRSSRIGDWRE